MKKINHADVARQILQFIKKDKYYRNVNACREEVAQKLDICPTLFSKIIEEQLGTTFPDLLNKYRAAYAKKILGTKSHSNNTLEEIAFISGFNSRMSLHRAFLQFYGITPGAYRKEFKNQELGTLN